MRALVRGPVQPVAVRSCPVWKRIMAAPGQCTELACHECAVAVIVEELLEDCAGEGEGGRGGRARRGR
jgi:hypothetical protein